jgi:lipid-A-disaccharide synthase
MKYYLIAGEASGDMHGAGLMHEIKKIDPTAQFRFWGGDLMMAEGGELVCHYKERAVMGFWEVLKNLPKVWRNIWRCKADMSVWKPDKVIFIDYAGFNLRIAPFAKSQGFETHYYISPKIWAWNTKRVGQIKKYIDKVYSIFPFEVSFYQKYGYENAIYVGNPLKDYISLFQPNPNFLVENNLDARPVIALLPGSRNQEIEKILPVMLSVCPNYPEYQFVVAGAPSYEEHYYRELAPDNTFKIVFNQTYNLLNISHAAMVTSGTATLETALFHVPQVVCYKTSDITYRIAKMLAKVEYISLVNLIMEREIVKELIQDELQHLVLRAELDKILQGSKNRKILLEAYDQMQQMLGENGAATHTAQCIVNKF